MNRDKIRLAFKDYASNYDLSDVKISLKVAHTYRVASLCEEIAKSMALTEEDRNLAWLSGMLHDIGRFEQVRQYGTFQDAVSVNHAMLSADLLFKEHLMDRFSDETELNKDSLHILERAIRLHNVFKLPSDLTERELMFCNILRDADKVDILKVNCEIPMSEIYDEPVECFYRDEITPEVMEDVRNRSNVDRQHVKTSVDHLVSHISLVFGLVYRKSLEEARDQGYLDQMLQFQSKNENTIRYFEEIGQIMNSFMEEKLSK